MRTKPNILICGTPGTGKSTHAEQVNEQLDLELFSVGEIVKRESLFSEFDETWQSHIVDDDKLLDFMEDKCTRGGCLIDWHDCSLFPESWIDLVVVLTCSHSLLWTRLEARNYSLAKIQENNEAEIMQVVLSDARELYDPNIVVELKSDEVDDIERNVERIVMWYQQWIKDH